MQYRTSITEVDFKKEGVTLQGSQGETFEARYLVDTSGQASILGRLLNLHDDPPRLRTHSRCLFTHMIDVKPHDDPRLPLGVSRLPKRLNSGTCHHIFDGGWLWVIPFNNRKRSTNPLVSVGLSFDSRRVPRPSGLSPEGEWKQFLERFPSIREQFKNARAVSEWVATDRLQRSCRTSVGKRNCLMAAAHGSGFVDALFSRGLANSTEVINALAARLLAALIDDDFSAERFEYLERLMSNNLVNNDRLVNCAYISFRDFDLWNAWFLIWALGVSLGELRLVSAHSPGPRFSWTPDWGSLSLQRRCP